MYTAKEAAVYSNQSKNKNVEDEILVAIENGNFTILLDKEKITPLKHVELLQRGYTVRPVVDGRMEVSWLP